jgi:NAD dependent epimerase/dehydratase family enzyme
MLVTPEQSPGVLMSAIHAALMGSYRTSNAGVMVSNRATHVSWTEHAAYQWNGQAHVLSVMKARVAQRRHAGFRPLAYV